MIRNGENVRVIEGAGSSAVFRPLYFAFVLAIVILEFPGIIELKDNPYSGISTRNLVIQVIQDDSPNRGKNLRAGDEIDSVGGTRIRNRFHYSAVLAANRSRAALPFVVIRNDTPVEETVEFAPMPNRLLAGHIALVLLAFSFLAVGSWVYLRRPDVLGALFAVNCAFLAYLLTQRPSVSNSALQLAGELVDDIVTLFLPAVFLHFFRVFPGRGRAVDRKRRAWRTALIYAVPTALFAASSAAVISRFYFHPLPASLASVVLPASALYFGAYFLASLVLFVLSYRKAPRAQKQKLRVVTAGTLLGVLPFLVTVVLRQLSPGENFYLEQASVLCLGFVPATFAYAILKHGAIELNHVVRRGIAYAVLTGAIVAVYYVVVYAIGNVMASEFSVSRYVFMPFSILVLAVIFAPARERVQRFVDRLFYRGEYVYKQEVLELNRQLGRKLTRAEIFDSFVERVDGLLKASFVAVYARDQTDGLALAQTRGACPELPPVFSFESFLSRYFLRDPTPLPVEFLDTSWEEPHMDEESARLLSGPGLAVCLPVVAHDQFMSLILLGEKRSGMVYTRTDAELLETFSEQLALVLQNADLLQSSIEKERLKNEVMLARDIQLSLLPARPPDHPAIEIHGYMLNSFEVGGDYFDYFFVDGDRIALAIGDASGKGIPAAMLMSSLQAVFKNLAIRDGLAPADLNAALNTYMLENTKVEQFASFFCGVLDLRNARFTFSNAGQCPALLFKRQYVDRLGQGGMVLGVRGAAIYREGNVGLEPGDLLLLYTDGAVEQKSPDGQFYGEARLMDFIKANRNLPIRELQTALYQDILGFGGGLQQDDITSVFACFKGS